MKNDKLNKEEKLDRKFSKKWAKKLEAGDEERLEAMESEELKKLIVKLEQAVNDTENDMAADPNITSLKEDLKEKAGVYKDSITICTAQIKFAAHLLTSRGQ